MDSRGCVFKGKGGQSDVLELNSLHARVDGGPSTIPKDDLEEVYRPGLTIDIVPSE